MNSLPQVLPAAPIRDSDYAMSTKDPCISLCKFDDDICIGCGRSKREIKSWKKMDKDEKRSVLAESASRLKTLKSSGRRKKK
jgi:predicted Fe-S protein YdhL (DUF1289 family)